MPEPDDSQYFGEVENVRTPLSAELNDVTSDVQIIRWLTVATGIVRSRFEGRFDDLVLLEKINLDQVHLACELAAERVARNPDGWRTFGIDNANGTRDHALSDGQVKILPEEWDRIYPDGSASGTQDAYGLTLGTRP